MEPRALAITVLPPIPLLLLMYRSGGTWDGMRVAGLILTIFGLVALTVARVQLGNAFSITPQARMLVTHGLYRRFSHPVYLFGTVTLAGVVLYFHRPLLLATLLVLVPAQIMRARREQSVLEGRFGEAYREYRRGTWM